ncbi:MAG: alpha/beta hydrolase [Clostridia bacterium]|nr:alpha/beta hydrolase [Clostridia bacterium]
MNGELICEGKRVHYEIHGSGERTILLLNGLMMTTASWKPFRKELSRDSTLVLTDFFDQGRSERLPDGYTHSVQVALVEAVAQELERRHGRSRFALAGLSYGGEIAIQYTLAYPQRVRRLILANTAGRTSSWLRTVGEGWNAAARSGSGEHYYLAAIPGIYSTRFFEERADWMAEREQALVRYFSQPEVLERMIRLTDSSRDYDVVHRLGEIACPTLILSGSEDGLVPVTEQQLLHERISGSVHVTLNGSGHASMYEVPDAFAALVAGFAALGDQSISI